MRANITYLTYKVFGGKDNLQNLMPALALSELSNQFCYLDNWIFDNKNNVLDNKEKISAVVASSAILRELAQQVIEEIKCSLATKNKISNLFSVATMLSYQGQLEETQTNIKTIKQFASDEDAIKYFEKKAKLLSGQLYGLSFEIGALLAKQNKQTCEKLRQLGIIFGTGLHLSNDIGDFAITEFNSFRSYQNQLSDIFNARLTLPIYYILAYGADEEKRALLQICNNPNPTKKEVELAVKALITSKALIKSKTNLNKYKNEFKNLALSLPENKYRDAIVSMANTIKVNKYLKSLNQLSKYYEQ